MCREFAWSYPPFIARRACSTVMRKSRFATRTHFFGSFFAVCTSEILAIFTPRRRPTSPDDLLVSLDGKRGAMRSTSSVISAFCCYFPTTFYSFCPDVQRARTRCRKGRPDRGIRPGPEALPEKPRPPILPASIHARRGTTLALHARIPLHGGPQQFHLSPSTLAQISCKTPLPVHIHSGP